MMEELYKVMDDLLDVEFQMKSGIDLLKELEEFYLSNPETEASEARKLAVLIKGYLQSMKSNIREIIRYIDDTTLEKSNEEKKDEQEAESTMSEKVQAGHFARVFDRQGELSLVAADGLMLRAVIGEDAAHVLHAGQYHSRACC